MPISLLCPQYSIRIRLIFQYTGGKKHVRLLTSFHPEPLVVVQYLLCTTIYAVLLAFSQKILQAWQKIQNLTFSCNSSMTDAKYCFNFLIIWGILKDHKQLFKYFQIHIINAIQIQAYDTVKIPLRIELIAPGISIAAVSAAKQKKRK